MPIYDLECLNCGYVSDFIIGLSEMRQIKDTKNMDLRSCDIACTKCGKSQFKKLLSTTAKMSENWSSWNKKTN